MKQLAQSFVVHSAMRSTDSETHKPLLAPLQLAVAAILIWTTGCGGSSEPTNSDSTAAGSGSGDAVNVAATDSSAADEQGPAASGSAKHGRDEVWVDEKGQKWFGNVPMDAFFDQPYTVASDTTPLGGTPSTAIVSNTPQVGSPGDTQTSAVTPTTTSETPAATTSGDSWSDLISAQMLDDEVKTIRNFLNENLQSVGTYNSSMLMIPPKAATLGALAGVAMEHPEAITWKEDATYIRNLAKQMNSDTLRSGPKDQKRLLELYEAVSDTLNRSRPASIEPLPESDGFAEVSEMRLVMHRMEEAEKRMKTEAGTDSAMNSRKDMVAHEASVLATLAKVVTLPGYGYEDDPAFKAYANEVIKSAMAMKSAAENNDFATYELSSTKVSTSCSNCHSDYKNN